MTGRLVAVAAFALSAFAANSLFCRLALASHAVDPATFTLVRISSAAVVLVLIGLRQTPSSAKDTGGRGFWSRWSGAGALTIYAVAFSYAYLSLPAGTGALLLFGAVQVTMIGYGLFKRERLAPAQWIGLAAAAAGLLLLLLPGASFTNVGGAAMMMAAGIAWGVYSLVGRQTTDPIKATRENFVRALVLSLPLLAMASGGATTTGLVWALLSGTIASGLGYVAWYTILPTLPATRAATLQLGVPVIAAMGGVLFLGEAVSLRLVLAAVAVLGGVALILRFRR